MKKITLSTILILLICLQMQAQEPNLLWMNMWDGNLAAKKDKGNAIVTDADGNVYATGIIFDQSSQGDFGTIAYTTNGDLMWSDLFNGDNQLRSEGQAIIVSSDGSVYSTGIVSENDGDVCLLKFNSVGNVWKQSYEPWFNASYYDEGKELASDSDGFIYLVSRIESINGNLSDTYTSKYDSDGNFIWGNDYSGASGADYAAGIALSPSGLIYTATSSYNFFGSGTQDMQTICYTTDGGQNWISNYTGEADNSEDRILDICVDDMENTAVCGSLHTTSGMDFAVRYQNNYGTPLWSYTKNGNANQNDSALVVCHHPNGILVTGKISENTGDDNISAIYTLLLDETGNIIWEETYYGTSFLGAEPHGMTIDAEGNTYVCGWVETSNGMKDALILKYDPFGELVFDIAFNSSFNNDDVYRSICLNDQNEILVTGHTHSAQFNSEFITAKYSNGPLNINSIRSESDLVVYPNPADELLFLPKEEYPTGSLIRIVNTSGQLVWAETVQNPILSIGIEQFQNGLYCLSILNANTGIPYLKQNFIKH